MSARETRVLLVTETLGRGGAERQVVTDARLLRAAGAEVVCAVFDSGPLASDLPSDVPLLLLHSRTVLGRVLELVRLMRRLRPDVVQAHLTSANFAAAVAGRVAGCPVMVTEHGMGYWRQDALKFRLAVRATYFCASRIACVCDEVACAKLRLEAAPPAKLDVQPNSYDDSRIGVAVDRRSSRRHLGVPVDGQVVSFVGRMARAKRVDLLLQVAAETKGLIPDVLFLIVGDGNELDKLRELAALNGLLDDVRFLGPLDNPKSVYDATDVFLLTSENEALPIALLEAQASGVPAVAFDVGGVGDVVRNEETGFLVPFDDVSQMTSRLVHLLQEPQLCARMGAQAHARAAERFSGTVRTARLMAVYRDMVQS